MRNVIITGAANGVGKAIANRLKDEKLILIDVDETNLEKIAKKLNASYYVCDVSIAEEIENTIHRIHEKYQTIDCLVNCAGMWISGDISKVEEANFKQMNELSRIQKVIDTNLFGVIGMIKTIFPIMKEQGYGQIITINSQSGVTCEPPFPIYNASKTGEVAFRKAIQNDLANHNIKITDVCPGLIKTEFYKRANDELPASVMENGLTAEDVANTVKFVFELPHEITIPCIEVRHIDNY